MWVSITQEGRVLPLITQVGFCGTSTHQNVHLSALLQLWLSAQNPWQTANKLLKSRKLINEVKVL